jgi:hypothetical protein
MGMRNEFYDAVKSIEGRHFQCNEGVLNSFYIFQALNSEPQPDYCAPFFKTTI